MQDGPAVGELVEAIRGFSKAKVLPDLEDPPARFRMLVAVAILGTPKEGLALGKDPATPEPLEDLEARGAELDRGPAGGVRYPGRYG